MAAGLFGGPIIICVSSIGIHQSSKRHRKQLLGTFSNNNIIGESTLWE